MSEDLDRAIRQEEGVTRPILVLYVKSEMNEDCCAANFERAVFMYRPVVEVAKNFKCIKSTRLEPRVAQRYGLDPKKPALLLFDAEGGLLHKVQNCQDPRKYRGALTSAFKLNDKRMKLKDKYLTMRREARERIGQEDYADAIRTLDRLMKKKDDLAGSVLALVEADRAELEDIGQRLFTQATELRSQQKLLEAYDLYQEIKKEFAKLEHVGKDASRCAREVKAELRDLGVTVR